MINRLTFLKKTGLFAFLPLVSTARLWSATPGKTFVILVGVETYEKSNQVSPVTFACNDVLKVSEAFQRMFKFSEVRKFTRNGPAGQILRLSSDAEKSDDKPTSTRVIEAFEDMADLLGESDTVIVLWAAHGTVPEEKQLLWTWDANPRSPILLEKSTVSLDQLQQILLTSPASSFARLIFLVDACRAEPDAKKAGAANTVPNTDSAALQARTGVLANVLRKEKGVREIAIFFACAKKQRAYANPTEHQGAFTYAFLQALERSQSLSLQEIAQFVKPEVLNWSRHRLGLSLSTGEDDPRLQCPVLRTEGSGTIHLVDPSLVASTGRNSNAARLTPVDTVAQLQVTTKPVTAQVTVAGVVGNVYKTQLLDRLSIPLEVHVSARGYKTKVVKTTLERGRNTLTISLIPGKDLPPPRDATPHLPLFANADPSFKKGLTLLQNGDRKGAEQEFLKAAARGDVYACTYVGAGLSKDSGKEEYLQSAERRDYVPALLWSWVHKYDEPIDDKDNGMNDVLASILQSSKTEAESRCLQILGELLPLIFSRAHSGDQGPQLTLGILYFLGIGLPRDEKKAFSWIGLSAKSDDGYAGGQCALGYAYLLGIGVGQNAAEAFKWFDKAAENDSSMADIELGRAYASGSGTRRDDAKAVEKFERAIQLYNGEFESSCSVAEFYVAELHLRGTQNVRNAKKAYEEFQHVAETDTLHSLLTGKNDMNVYIYLVLAQMFNLSQHPRRQEISRILFGDYETNFNTRSCIRLGEMYTSGIGRAAPSPGQAAEWFLKAARKGDMVGQWQTGRLYLLGSGVPKNLKVAIAWFRKSAAQNYKPALEELHRLNVPLK